MKVYNKLVRDKIPDIIKAEGRTVKTRVLNDQEYRDELNKKLKEEVNEYLDDNNVEELADIVEVIYGILNSMDVSIEEFENIRKYKVDKRGAFNKKVFLEEEKNMTEREKMLAGELYDCGDAELLKQWHKAKNLVRDYNNLISEDLEKKDEILSELLGGKGKNLWITAPFYVDYGNNIYFGNNCEVNMNCTFLDDNKIIIGDNALIAPNVQIYTAFHPTNAIERFGEPKEDGSFEFCKTQTAPVIIGDNVWIGGGVIILPGVKIGNNVTIGAGSVVTKDIPDNKIAYGNPCRIIRDNI